MSDAAQRLARDVLLAVTPDAHRYAVHAALDARWGRRSEVGYLWTLGSVMGGSAVRVRLPPQHPDGTAGIDLLAPPKGACFGFRLCVNITQKDQATGRRSAWARDAIAPRRAWLDRRAAEHGFLPQSLQIEVGRCHIRKGRGFWLDETWFTGTLTVTDAARFADVLIKGVGQRGAFGFGLLEIFDLPHPVQEASAQADAS